MLEREKVRLQENHDDYSEILGYKNFSQATKRLNNSLLLYYAGILDKDKCYTCKKQMTLEDFTIAHIEPWRRCFSREGDADLFWDINNIALECSKCNTSESQCHSDKSIIEPPIRHKENENVKNPITRNQLNFDYDLLGIDFGKANHQLRRRILFEWCKMCGLNVCSQGCPKQDIDDIKDFSIEHLKPWLSGENNEEKKRLFFDLDNIGCSHLCCNSSASGIGKGISGYHGVGRYNDPRTGYSTWRARIMVDGESISPLCSEDIVRVAEAYDLAVLKYRDGKGLLNFPDKVEQYRKQISEGWGETIVCRICGDKNFRQGLCRKHNYEFGNGKEQRQISYAKEKQKLAELRKELGQDVIVKPNKEIKERQRAAPTNNYYGVENFNKEKGYFRTRVNYKGHQFYLQTLLNEVEAAELSDLILLKYSNRQDVMNFPEKLTEYESKIQNGWKSEVFETKVKLFQNTSGPRLAMSSIGKSKYRGVDQLWNKGKDRWRWRLSIYVNKKKISKNFATSESKDEKLAAMLYDLINLRMNNSNGGLNFPENIEIYKNINYQELGLESSLERLREINII